MELRALDQFLTVAEHGSFTAAAVALNLSQPAVTKSIRRLEDEVGARLFERLPRGVALTTYGRSLARHARLIGNQLRQADAELEALKGGSSGQIRVGAGPSWMSQLLPKAIGRLLARAPGVRIQVMEGFDDSLKEALRQGDLDLVVVALQEGPDEAGLVTRPLVDDTLMVVARAAHPLRDRPNLTLAELRNWPWILTGPHTLARQRLQRVFQRDGLRPPEPVVETDSVEFKFAFLRQTDHLSFHTRRHLVESLAEEVRPLEVPGGDYERTAGLILREGTELGPAARALLVEIERVCDEQNLADQAAATGSPMT